MEEIPLPADDFQGNFFSKNALISCLVRQPLFPLTKERKEKNGGNCVIPTQKVDGNAKGAS